MNRRSFPILLGFAAVGCFGVKPTPAPDLSFKMRAIRADVEIIATELPLDQFESPIHAAERILLVDLTHGADPSDPFVAYAESLRVGVRELRNYLQAEDRDGAERTFIAMLDRCDACHFHYRPGGIAGRIER